METKKRKRAAEYLRMSTERQEYSTGNQADAIRIYASLRGLEIVATYKDEGKSGVTLSGRTGLQALLADVETGTAEFSTIIVYDVSRWGRFQDADEAAYYEYMCKRAGIRVEYCAEQFENDGSPLSAVLKGLKRAMAGEYSRELSAKVWTGQKRLIEKGFRQGGSAGYGLRRQAVDSNGKPRVLLSYGEQKNLQTDRVILVPGPSNEVETVKWIYDRWIKGATEREIVADLNRRGIKTDFGRPFTKMVVHAVLTSEKYAGTHVWNRTTTRLQTGRQRNRPNDWIKSPKTFAAIIDRAIFEKAQAVRRARAGRLSDEEILIPLRRLLQQHGYLTYGLIEQAGTYPTVGACVARFGSIRETYKRLGYTNTKDHSYVDVNQRVRSMLPLVCAQVFNALIASGLNIRPETIDRLNISGLDVSIIVSRYRTAKDTARGWHVIADGRHKTDLFVMARLDTANQTVMDYYVLPLQLLSALHFNLTERKVRAIGDSYHCSNLDELPDKVASVRTEIARGTSYAVTGRGMSLRFRRDGKLL